MSLEKTWNILSVLGETPTRKKYLKFFNKNGSEKTKKYKDGEYMSKKQIQNIKKVTELLGEIGDILGEYYGEQDDYEDAYWKSYDSDRMI